MSTSEDEKALTLLEKAVYRAQASLEKTQHFQPFIMLLNDSSEVEVFENEIQDSTESYTALEEILTERMKKNDVDVLALLVDTNIPEKFVKDVPTGIRIHLEEKSQLRSKIGARFLFVPYELCKRAEGEMFVKLHTPIPVGFPAEYIIN